MNNTGISKLQRTLLSTLIASAMVGAHAEDALELPVVQVTGTAERSYKAPEATIGKIPLAPREIPNSVSVLTREQMDDQGMTTMQEALGQVTGVLVTNNDTASTQYYARGYSLGVMYDGVPAYSGLTPSYQLDLSLYDRVEVLRGPAGLMQGVSEPAGVVNLVKKKPTKNAQTSWAATMGSYDNKRVEADINRPLNEDKTLRSRFVVMDEDRGYFYQHTHGKKWAALGALEYDLTPATTLSLSFASQDWDIKAPWSGLPTSSALNGAGQYILLDVSPSTFNVPDWGKQQTHIDEISASAEHRFDNSWTTKVSYNRRDVHEYFKYAYTTSAVNVTTNRLNYGSMKGEYDYAWQGLDVFANGPFSLGGRTHQALIGVNTETYEYSGRKGFGPNFNNVYFGNPGTIAEPAIAYTSGTENVTRQQGIYTQVRWSLADPLTWVVGARTTTFKNRYRNISPSATGLAWTDGAKANNEITPYTGVIYTPIKEVTLYASISDIFVPQTQRKADGTTLDPRTGTQKEIGIKGEFLDGKLGTSLAFFNLRDKNRAITDIAYPPAANFYLNAGEVESKGYEIEINGKPASGLDLSAGYTRLATKYLTDRNSQGQVFSFRSPTHQLKLWANYSFPAASTLAGLDLGAGVIAQSETQGTRGSAAKIADASYAVVNGRIGYRLDKTYSLNLQINNIFDRKYYASVGMNNTYNFFGEPRSFMLTLKGSY